MARKQQAKHDYERLGRMLVEIYETGYSTTGQSLKHSFLKGIVGGFGGVIGATILVALLVWALTAFKRVPLVGPFVEKVRNTVQEER